VLADADLPKGGSGDGAWHDLRMPPSDPRRPAVVAHRGASEAEAEHTLAAYKRAIADGADALECDVRLTRDGVLVCVHDRRVDRTSSGRGVLSTLELGDLEALDFGPSPSEDPQSTVDWEAPDHDRSRVLTLERLLETVLDCGRPLELAIETKHPTRYAGLVELELVELLGRFGLAAGRADRPPLARVMSFAPSSLRRIHAMAPDIRTVLLFRRVPLRYRDGALPPRFRIAGPSLEVLRAYPDWVGRLQARGHEVHVWTVNESEDVAFVVELGVDAIITDRPGPVLAQLSDQQRATGGASQGQ